MKNHTKVYLKFFDYDEGDFIPCEVTGNRAMDISHNDPRGMGGRPNDDLDTPENLMALTRDLHNYLEQNPNIGWWFQLVHMNFMVTRKPYYESKWSKTDPIFKNIIESVYRKPLKELGDAKDV